MLLGARAITQNGQDNLDHAQVSERIWPPVFSRSNLINRSDSESVPIVKSQECLAHSMASWFVFLSLRYCYVLSMSCDSANNINLNTHLSGNNILLMYSWIT